MILSAKKCLLVSISSTFFLFGIPLAYPHSLKTRDVSAECSARYAMGSEHRKTCESYDSSKVKVLPRGVNLNTAVRDASAGELLIVPSTTPEAPYRLTAPLHLPDRASLLADNDGVNGFFSLAQEDGYSIGDDKVYCYISLGDNSKVTGSRVNATDLSATNQLYFNELNERPRVIIYSRGKSGFDATWNSLVGRPQMDALLLAENADDRGETKGGTSHVVRRNWLVTSGAKHAARVESAGNENIVVKHNAAFLGDLPSDTSKQLAFHVKYGGGEVVHNDIIFNDDDIFVDQQRVAIALEDVSGLSVAENAIISEQETFDINENLLREEDVAYEFIESAGADLQLTMRSESVSKRMSLSTGNARGKGLDIDEVYLQESVPYFKTEEEFFSQEAPRPRAGVCFTPLYMMENLDKTRNVTGDDAWEYACGTGTSRSDFNLEEEYDRNAPASCNYKPLRAASGTGWTVAIAEGIVIAAYVIYRIWDAYFRATGQSPDGHVMFENEGQETSVTNNEL